MPRTGRDGDAGDCGKLVPPSALPSRKDKDMAAMDGVPNPRVRPTATHRIGGAQRRAITWVVLALTAAASTLVLLDAVFHSATGGPSPFAYNASPVMAAIYSVAEIAVHAGFAVVLVLNGPEIDAGHRFRTVLRTLLVAATAALAAMSVVGEVVEVVSGPIPEDGALMAAGTVAFFVIMIAPQVLGVTMLVQGDRSPGAWVLSAAVPIFVLSLVLGALGSPWGHPGYFEATVFLGIALLGFSGSAGRAPRAARAAAGG